ncbi:dynamin family protein [Weissella paramesenteroides]|uniref:dynamin family protein n=1 Tax=Weissella paramesenteroides TaxID=1249 RepID=UPI00103BC9FF|nr:dynamin family protein [Weissella paramesenteroides]RZQ57410.1 helix-turn-helix domain-containing protein [Weissella paramesenteroides]
MEKINIRKLRERINMTQDEMAQKLGTTKASISNWEASPQNLSIEKMEKYLDIVGATLGDLKKEGCVMPLYSKANKDMINFRNELQKTLLELEQLEVDKSEKGTLSEFNTKRYSLINDLRKVQVSSRKTRVLIVGPSDSGKSTLINNILGESVVPAHWTPATGMAIKILHSLEKPSWVTGNTIIVKNNLNIDKAPAESWNLRNRQYFDEHVQIEGNRDIVNEYGEREGANFESESAIEETIFTYVDSEILNNIEIWDTPGTAAGADENSDIDEQISLDSRNNADALIYLMQANSFMHKQDFPLLQRDISKLPKIFNNKNGLGDFSNLFVVASQADIIESDEERNLIIKNGASRFNQTLSNKFFQLIEGKSNNNLEIENKKQSLADRFFVLSNKSGNNISEKFMADLDNFINKSQIIMLENSKKSYDKALQLYKEQINDAIQKLLKDRDDQDLLNKEVEYKRLYLPKILKGNTDLKNTLKEEVKKARERTIKNFKSVYETIINQTNLRKQLDDGNYKNNNDDKELFATKISGILNDKMTELLDEEADNFTDLMKNTSEKVQSVSSVPKDFFDFKAAGLGLAASGLTMGAFAAVAASITSNLGLYTLVAQIGGLLTTAGIISSPIVATTTVAAFGGPVGWVIGLSVLIGSVIFSIFHRNAWKDNLIKTLIDSYEKENALEKYIQNIDKFMEDTLDGVDKLKEGLDLAAKEDLRLSEERTQAHTGDFDKEIKQLKLLSSIL